MSAREQQIVVSFYSDDETAKAVAEQMRRAAEFLINPTKEAASELFRLGAEAVCMAAEAERQQAAA